MAKPLRWSVLVACLLAAAPAVTQSLGWYSLPGGDEVAQLSEGIEEAREEVATRLEADSGDAEAWGYLMWIRAQEAQLTFLPRLAEMGENPPREQIEPVVAEIQLAAEKAVRSVAEEWMTADPDSPGPYLALAQFDEVWLDRAVERFPDSAEVVGYLAMRRLYAGEAEEASRLVEAFLANHPEDEQAYLLAMQLAETRGDTPRATELRELWRRRFEDSLEVALSRAVDGSIALAERRSLVEDLLGRELAGDELGRLCSTLDLDEELGAESLRCWERRLAEAEAEERYEARWRLVELYGGAGDWAAAERAAGSAADEEKRRALDLEVVTAAASAGECSLLRARLDREAAQDEPDTLLRLGEAARACGESAAAGRLAREALETMEPEELAYRAAGAIEIVGAETVEALLWSRIQSDLENPDLHRALHRTLDEAGDQDAVFSHLLTWTGVAPGPEASGLLSEELERRGHVDEALEIATDLARDEPSDFSLQERVVELLLGAGLFQEADTFARQLGDAQDEQATRFRSRLLARIAAERDDPALVAELLLGLGPGLDWDDQELLLEALAEQGRVQDVVAVLQEQPKDSGLGFPGSRVGTRLAELGLHEEAIPYFERDRTARPHDAGAVSGLAGSLVQIGRTQDALELLGGFLADHPEKAELALDEAKIQLALNRPEAAVARLAPYAEGRIHWEKSYLEDELLLLLGKAQGAAGLDVEAVETLERLVERHEESYEGLLELARALRRAGEREAATATFVRFLEATEHLEKYRGEDCECYCDILANRSRVERELDLALRFDS